jgi:hypothetical protein
MFRKKESTVAIEPPLPPTELELAKQRVFETCAAFDAATQAMRDLVPGGVEKAHLRAAQAAAQGNFYRALQAYARLKESSK